MNMHIASTTTASIAMMAQSAVLADSVSMSLSPPPLISDRTLLPIHSTIDWFGAAVIDWFGAAVSREGEGWIKSFVCTRGTRSRRTCDRRVGAASCASIGTSKACGGSARIPCIAYIARMAGCICTAERVRCCIVGIADPPLDSISGSIIPGNISDSTPGLIPGTTPGIAATCPCPSSSSSISTSTCASARDGSSSRMVGMRVFFFFRRLANDVTCALDLSKAFYFFAFYFFVASSTCWGSSKIMCDSEHLTRSSHSAHSHECFIQPRCHCF